MPLYLGATKTLREPKISGTLKFKSINMRYKKCHQKNVDVVVVVVVVVVAVVC